MGACDFCVSPRSAALLALRDDLVSTGYAFQPIEDELLSDNLTIFIRPVWGLILRRVITQVTRPCSSLCAVPTTA